MFPRTIGVFLLGALLLSVLPGCWMRSSGQTARMSLAPELVPQDAWPPRDVELVRGLVRGPREVPLMVRLEGADPALITDRNRGLVEDPFLTLTYEAVHGQGVVRIFEDEQDSETDALVRTLEVAILGFSPQGRFLTSRAITNEDAIRARQERSASDEKANAAAAQVGMRYNPEIADLFLDEGVGFRLPPVRGEGETPYKGVMLHLWAIAGNDYETRTAAALAEAGWAVIDLDTITGIRAPLRERTIEQLEAHRKERQRVVAELDAAHPMPVEIAIESLPVEERSRIERTWMRERSTHPAYRELVRLDMIEQGLLERTFEACEGTDLRALGAHIAAEIDQQLAGNAYFAEAIVDHIRTQRPDLAHLPMVVVGFSAGALTAPTTVARLRERIPDAVDAVVLIGGGVDLFDLSQRSSFTDAGVRIRCEGKRLPDRRLQEVRRAYREATRLDPLKTATALRGLPVLQVHGMFDGWVPASGGRELTRLLEGPDLWQVTGGHTVLFYLLPGQAKRLDRWMSRAVGVAPGKPPAR